MAYLSKLTANHILTTAPKVSQSIVEALMCILEKKRVSQSKVKCLRYENNFFFAKLLSVQKWKEERRHTLYVTEPTKLAGEL